MKSDSIVIAKRWDGLGGRLHAILNAWSVARALDLAFRFVWPRGADIALHEPRELFSDTFIDRFELADSGYASRVVLSDPTVLSLPDAMDLCRAANTNSMIEISECFDVVAFVTEPAEAAQARFRNGLREIGWSRASHALIEHISDDKFLRGYSAIHIRAGDIVAGNWRQFVPVEKYVPTAYVEFAIQTLSGADRDPVVVVSDNERYVCHLKSRFNTILTPGDIVPGYAALTELQRAFADILVLSRARRIVGPRASAFSQLAAHLGNVTILGVDDLMAEEDARRWLCDGIARVGKNARRSDVLRPLLARDICWFLDVFSDTLAVGDQIALAHEATRLEPDFCGSLNRAASALALAGHRRASQKASLRAQCAAAMADRHSDPLVESLATSISAKVLALTFGTRWQVGRELLERLGLSSIVRLLDGGIDRTVILDDIKRNLKNCEILTPFQIQHGHLLANLRFQIATLGWLTAADDRLREIAKATIKPAHSEPLYLRSWRPSGFSNLRAPGSFPQALRNLEVLTIRIARGIGTALSGASSRSPPLGNVDGITTSPSGLRWVNGWAYNADVGRTELAVGYFCDDAIVSGGVTFVARPDVAAALKDPRALNCGFSFPVPLAFQDKVSDFQSTIRITDR
ncbi:MAG: hypothetical protein ACLQJ0_01790 [Steroidobacteraceae bacterium]